MKPRGQVARMLSVLACGGRMSDYIAKEMHPPIMNGGGRLTEIRRMLADKNVTMEQEWRENNLPFHGGQWARWEEYWIRPEDRHVAEELLQEMKQELFRG